MVLIVLAGMAATYKLVMWIIQICITISNSKQVGFISLTRFNEIMKYEAKSFKWKKYDEWFGGCLVHNGAEFHCTDMSLQRNGEYHGMLWWNPISYCIAVEILKYHKHKIKFEQNGCIKKFKLISLWSAGEEAKQLLSSE
jgi:hypothetical protein